MRYGIRYFFYSVMENGLISHIRLFEKKDRTYKNFINDLLKRNIKFEEVVL